MQQGRRNIKRRALSGRVQGDATHVAEITMLGIKGVQHRELTMYNIQVSCAALAWQAHTLIGR